MKRKHGQRISNSIRHAPSEWASQPRSWGMLMPPMMRGSPGSRRWRSKPWPTRNGRAGGFGAAAAATAGWCSAWSAATTAGGCCRRRRDARAGKGVAWMRVLGAVEMGEARKREEAEAMASRSDGRDSAVAESSFGVFLAAECEKRPGSFFCTPELLGKTRWESSVGDAVRGDPASVTFRSCQDCS